MIHTGDAVPTVEQVFLEANRLDIDVLTAFDVRQQTYPGFSTNTEQKGITVAKVVPTLHCIVLAIAILSHSSSQGNGHKISLVQFSSNRPQLRPGTPQAS